MTPPLDSVASALFVEPRIAAQLALLEAAHAARAPIELSCVATCGGAQRALEDSDYDCLLLSTSLCYDADEQRELAALIQAARARGIAAVSLGPGDLNALSLPVHEQVSFDDVARGSLSEALERACIRAKVDWAIAIGLAYDQTVPDVRLSRSLAPVLEAWVSRL